MEKVTPQNPPLIWPITGENSPAGSYKSYIALITQTGTNAPVATVLSNTLGGTVIWTRADLGRYTATLTGAFPAGKTWPIAPIKNNAVLESVLIIAFLRLNDNEVRLESGMDGDQVDDLLLNAPIEIRVYN